jgi:hypothetical protein
VVEHRFDLAPHVHGRAAHGAVEHVCGGGLVSGGRG